MDILIIVERSDDAFERRSIHFDANALLVPTDVIVYTHEEWQQMNVERLAIRKRSSETILVYEKEK